MSQLSRTMRNAVRQVRAIANNKRGVAAIEFGFIVPVLLCMYLVTMEASDAIEVNKKVSRMASTVADLVTQQSRMQKSEVLAVMKIATASLQPYNRSKPSLEITAIQMGTETTPVARAAWSVKLDSSGNAAAVVAKTSVINDARLDNIRTAGAFYIRVSSHLPYQSMMAYSPTGEGLGLLSAFTNIQMGETFYLRPRVSTTIPCDDCP
ncbi:MAG: pilus assembly protein [Rhizobiales bacterium]|nr:pilus assembly protein [Hyphomicrobiales bacterium]